MAVLLAIQINSKGIPMNKFLLVLPVIAAVLVAGSVSAATATPAAGAKSAAAPVKHKHKHHHVAAKAAAAAKPAATK